MCGIVGALMFGDLDQKQEKIRQESAIFLITELLKMTEDRGKDATGVATVFENGNYMIQKMGIKSSDFLLRFGGSKEDYEGYLKIWRNYKSPAKMFIGHCRKSSVGNSNDNVNNHPIRIGDTIAIHNGTLTNHNQIINSLGGKKDGIVDSEAIVRLLHKYTDNGKLPVTTDLIEEVTNRLQGTYAVLAFSGNNPYQMSIFRDGRPVELVLIKELNLVLVASEVAFLRRALARYAKMCTLYSHPNTIKIDITKAEFKYMPDDAIIVFDLSKEITSATNLASLYEFKKTSRSNKVWLKSTQIVAPNNISPVNNASSVFGYNNSNNEKPNHETLLEYNKNVTSPKTNKITAAHINNTNNTNGMVYSKRLNKYIAEEIVVLDKGSVELKIPQLSKPPNYTKPALKSTDSTNLTKVDDKTNKSTVKIDRTKTVEVSVIVDTDALTAADKAYHSIEKFKVTSDVMNELEVSNQENLIKLPIHSLANRIKAHLFKSAYYDGYVEGRKNTNSETVQKLNVKKCKAERVVRILKHVVNLWIETTNKVILNRNPNTSSYNQLEEALHKVVKKALINKTINSKEISSVFTEGDILNPTLSRLVSVTEHLEEK